jgi:hypothetical protein
MSRVADAGGAGIGQQRGSAAPVGGHCDDRAVDAGRELVLYGGLEAIARPATRR